MLLCGGLHLQWLKWPGFSYEQVRCEMQKCNETRDELICKLYEAFRMWQKTHVLLVGRAVNSDNRKPICGMITIPFCNRVFIYLLVLSIPHLRFPDRATHRIIRKRWSIKPELQLASMTVSLELTGIHIVIGRLVSYVT